MQSSSEFNKTFRDTLNEHCGSIVRYAYTYVKNIADAEDIAQDVFIIYLNKKPSFNSEGHKKAWFLRVTANKCKDFLKSSRRKRTMPMPDDLCYMPKESYDLLNHVFSMEEKYRIPIHLFYYEGYSIREIAQIMSRKPATVGTWLARGRKLLKDMLGEDFNE